MLNDTRTLFALIFFWGILIYLLSGCATLRPPTVWEWSNGYTITVPSDWPSTKELQIVQMQPIAPNTVNFVLVRDNIDPCDAKELWMAILHVTKEGDPEVWATAHVLTATNKVEFYIVEDGKCVPATQEAIDEYLGRRLKELRNEDSY